MSTKNSLPAWAAERAPQDTIRGRDYQKLSGWWKSSRVFCFARFADNLTNVGRTATIQAFGNSWRGRHVFDADTGRVHEEGDDEMEEHARREADIWSVRMSRRTFLRKALTGVLATEGMALLATAYPLLVEPNWLHVTYVRIPLSGLPSGLHRLRIAQFSDVHLGPYTRDGHLRDVVRAIMAHRPDIILFTGDMVTRRENAEPRRLEIFRHLSAPLGIWGVLGNHDHWMDADRVHELIERWTPIRILRNENVSIQAGDEHFWLVGVDDAWVGADKPEEAFAGVPEDAVRLVLMHEPDAADWLPLDGRTLQLSGHTHGGQVRLPFVGALLLPYLGRKYDAGLYRVKGGWVYTNRGVGVITPPVRFNCRPEVTIIELA